MTTVFTGCLETDAFCKTEAALSLQNNKIIQNDGIHLHMAPWAMIIRNYI